MINQLQLHQVSVHYGAFQAVREVSLQLELGQIGCLLGPSGCGKTSLLRAIAGFEPVSCGEIRLHGEVISRLQYTLVPERRRVGMVFQDFALFPHLDVARNIGFGLGDVSRAVRDQRVTELLELVGLVGMAKAFPHELSGGQQQRVGLARALAPGPEILLMDEPFSSLDTELREQLAREIRELLKRNRVTAILVTHDQHEAFAMADQVALLQNGRIAQCDSPYNLYHKPANEVVAGFIGQGTIINATVNAAGELSNGLGILGRASGQRTPGEVVKLLVRPDDIQYVEHSPLQLAVIGRSFRGAQFLYELALPDAQSVLCLAPSHVDVAVGKSLPVGFDLRHAVVFDSLTG